MLNSIKKLRKEAGLNQEEFAKLFNVHQTAVSQWETGKTSPDTDIIIKMAKYFKISTDDILGNTDIKKSPSNMEEENNIAKEIIEGLQKGGAMIAGKGKNGVDTIQVSDEEFEVMKNMLEAMRKAREK